MLGAVATGPAPSHAATEIETERVPLELAAGEIQNHRFDLSAALRPGVSYRADLAQRRWWDREVELGFISPSPAADPLATATSAVVRRGEPVRLRVVTRRCSPSRAVATALRLRPLAGTGRHPSPPSVVVPISVTTQGDEDECRRAGVISVIRASLVGTFVFFLHCLVVNTHFLSREQLKLRLRPLRWDGRAYVPEAAAPDVEHMIERELRRWRRAVNWLRANPLRFSLPGRAYFEAAELLLEPQSDASRLVLKPHHDFYAALEAQPDRGTGGLFVSARDGLRFFAVPNAGKIGGLTSPKPRRQDSKEGPRRIDLHRGERLLYGQLRSADPQPRRQQQVGRVGWEI